MLLIQETGLLLTRYAYFRASVGCATLSSQAELSVEGIDFAMLAAAMPGSSTARAASAGGPTGIVIRWGRPGAYVTAIPRICPCGRQVSERCAGGDGIDGPRAG